MICIIIHEPAQGSFLHPFLHPASYTEGPQTGASSTLHARQLPILHEVLQASEGCARFNALTKPSWPTSCTLPPAAEGIGGSSQGFLVRAPQKQHCTGFQIQCCWRYMLTVIVLLLGASASAGCWGPSQVFRLVEETLFVGSLPGGGDPAKQQLCYSASMSGNRGFGMSHFDHTEQ